MKRWIALALFLPGFASAGSMPSRTPGTYTPMEGVEYYCTDADGARVELGQVICIRASCLTWLARCDMSLNIPMWRKVQDGCPAAGSDILDRLHRVRFRT